MSNLDKLYKEALDNQKRAEAPRTRDRIRDYKQWAQGQGLGI